MPFQKLTTDELRLCVEIACRCVHQHLFPDEHLPGEIEQAPLSDLPSALSQSAACFVTLKVDGELQGCLGSIWPERPLIDEIKDKAVASAERDPRFAPLRIEQLDGLTVEVSVLSRPEPFVVENEPALLAHLSQHKVGVILSDSRHRALFLPQVWLQLPEPKSFIQHLKHKGGWPVDYWSTDIEVQLFNVDSAELAYSDIYP